MDKKELRKEVLRRRDKIQNKEEKSRIIQFEVMNHPLYQDAEVIALYNSFSSEVSTKELIKQSLLRKSVVLLPKIVDKRMIFVRINENTEYKTSSFHVSEPIGEEYTGDIDLIITPGVAFTKDGKRLGYGGGYYDRFLKRKSIKTIGICFEEQIMEDIPTEEHDVLIDYIQTEDNTYTGKKNYQKIR